MESESSQLARTSNNRWYFRILCTGFNKYDPRGNVWLSTFCVDVSSELVCVDWSSLVSRAMASG